MVQEPLSLCLAVQSGDVEAVQRLLLGMGGGEEGGYGDTERAVDQRNEQSHAPLHLACTSGNVYVLCMYHIRTVDAKLKFPSVFVELW